MTLEHYLQKHSEAAYRYLTRSLEGLSEREAEVGATAEWRRYRYGTGLDGSIAGIVLHVAAWKHAFATGLETGYAPDAAAVVHDIQDWSHLLSWLDEGQARVRGAIAAALEGPREAGSDPNLSPFEAQTIEFESREMPFITALTILADHDHYHAGQITLLRQQQGHTLSDD